MTSPRLQLTAAVPSKDLLSVVTLSWNGSHLYLVPSVTAFFMLQSDDQLGVRQMASDLWAWFSERQVGELLVRRGPTSGRYQASAGSTKIETILQLLPLTCAHVHVQKAVGWARQQEWLLPLSQKDLRATHSGLQEEAILSAAFGISSVLNVRRHSSWALDN